MRTVVYCIVPRKLAGRWHGVLRRHFADDPGVEVVVERRESDRRHAPERRAVASDVEDERRRVRAQHGRRYDERRAASIDVEPPPLPRWLRPVAGKLRFVERLEPSKQQLEDRDTARLVTRFQAGDLAAFEDLYMRYFDRVYAYLLVALGDRHGAEDMTQQVFTNVFQALPRYERRRQPFRAWLFTIARNLTITELTKRGRVDLSEPEVMTEQAEREGYADLSALNWTTDRELLMLIERLPVSQQRVLFLRFALDLTSAQVAAILDRSPDDVRTLQRRALLYLRERLAAMGRGGERRPARIRRLRPQADVLRARRFALLGG